MNGALLMLGVLACILLGYRLLAQWLEGKRTVLLVVIARLKGRKAVA